MRTVIPFPEEAFEAVKKLGLEGIVSKRAKAPYRSGPSRNWLKTKNYAEVELPILGVVQEAGKPILALLGNNKQDRTYIASASVVVNKLTRDLFWQAVGLLAEGDGKTYALSTSQASSRVTSMPAVEPSRLPIEAVMAHFHCSSTLGSL